MKNNKTKLIMEQTIKQDDIVRLTDPLDNGTIVRIEKVDENGFAEWLGGSQYCDMEQNFLHNTKNSFIFVL